jgi:hypothetical protein
MSVTGWIWIIAAWAGWIWIIAAWAGWLPVLILAGAAAGGMRRRRASRRRPVPGIPSDGYGTLTPGEAAAWYRLVLAYRLPSAPEPGSGERRRQR